MLRIWGKNMEMSKGNKGSNKDIPRDCEGQKVQKNQQDQNDCENQEVLKKLLRKQMFDLRKKLLPEQEAQKNQDILKQLITLDQECGCPNWYAYIDYHHEAGTKAWIEYLWTQNRQIAVPRVEGKEIRFYWITCWDDVESGCMGILEPKESCTLAQCLDSHMVVPGVAFGRDGSRMGYGGGFYDRFFATEPKHHTVGICFDFQMVDVAPVEEHDMYMEKVIFA